MTQRDQSDSPATIALRAARAGELVDDGGVAYILTYARAGLATAIARSAFKENRKIGDPLRDRLVALQVELSALDEDWPR